MEFLDNFLTILKDVRLHPIAVPVLIGLATVLATVVLFYVLSRPKGSQGRKSSKGSDRTKTRTSEQGVRRSSRTHKVSSKYEDTPEKTPAKARIPSTPGVEAVTVTPKTRARKTPKPPSKGRDTEPRVTRQSSRLKASQS